MRGLIWGLAVLVWVGLAGGVALLWYGYDLPPVHRLKGGVRKPSISVFSEDGVLLATYGDLFGDPVEIKDLPAYVPAAFIAAEDRRFYAHCGLDILGLFRALFKNICAGYVVQGGSTITQQVAKNLFFSSERTLRRKIQEALVALWLEHTFSKREILTIYLNRTYFGAGAYGIDAASLRYLGKSALKLSLHEAALLAGLLRAPSRYSPVHNFKVAAKRAALILALMLETGAIAPQEARRALLEEIRIVHSPYAAENCRYFTDWVLEILPECVSVGDKDLCVITTFKEKWQNEASQQLRKALEAVPTAHQGALICFDSLGAVRALVGGVDYSQSQFNRALALRSSGSTFKIFVYLTALNAGYTSESLISDAPITLGSWKPSLYYWKPRGQITLRDAFAFSVNPISVRLTCALGRDCVVKMARRLGISTRQPDDLTIALGSGEVTLLELCSAYATVCGGGRRVTPFAIREVSDRNGVILYRHAHNAPQVLPGELCEKMRVLLRAVVDYGTGRRAKRKVPVFAKTGTSNDGRDAWFIGTSEGVTTGIWIGNDNGAPMRGVTGGKLPAEIWNRFMTRILRGGNSPFVDSGSPPPEDFPMQHTPLSKERKAPLDILLDEIEHSTSAKSTERLRSAIGQLISEVEKAP